MLYTPFYTFKNYIPILSYIVFTAYFLPFCRQNYPFCFATTILLLPHSHFPAFFYASPTLSVPLFFAFVSIFFQNRLAFFASKNLPFLSPKLLGFLNAIHLQCFGSTQFKNVKPYFCPSKTPFLHAKNHTFAMQKPYFCFVRM